MNQKYIVKIEKGNLEQSFKISEMDYVIKDVEDIKAVIDESFINKALQLFDTMQDNLEEALTDF